VQYGIRLNKVHSVLVRVMVEARSCRTVIWIDAERIIANTDNIRVPVHGMGKKLCGSVLRAEEQSRVEVVHPCKLPPTVCDFRVGRTSGSSR
jgi:hypothetical protein